MVVRVSNGFPFVFILAGGQLSPRSLSREIAASSCIILEDMYMENSNDELKHDMYIEDSNGELKHVRGIKREYPEPRMLNFGLSTQDKTERQRLKSSTSTSFDLSRPLRVRTEHITSVLINWIKNCQTEDTLRYLNIHSVYSIENLEVRD